MGYRERGGLLSIDRTAHIYSSYVIILNKKHLIVHIGSTDWILQGPIKWPVFHKLQKKRVDGIFLSHQGNIVTARLCNAL